MLLYKYYPLERVSFFDNRLVRFTQPNDLNDPFELSPYIELNTISKAIPTEEIFDEMIRNGVDAELNKWGLKNFVPAEKYESFILEAKAKIAPTIPTLAREHAKHVFAANIDHLCKSIGILCLSEDPNNLLMWSHYTNSHNGFCVGFDGTHPFFRGGKGFIEKIERVAYRNSRPKFSLDSPDMHFLYTKSLDWAYEQEWRVFKALENPDKLITKSPYDAFLYQVPVDCIKSVIVGARVTKDDTDRIKMQIAKSELASVSVFKAELSPDTFQLRTVEARL